MGYPSAARTRGKKQPLTNRLCLSTIHESGIHVKLQTIPLHMYAGWHREHLEDNSMCNACDIISCYLKLKSCLFQGDSRRLSNTWVPKLNVLNPFWPEWIVLIHSQTEKLATNYALYHLLHCRRSSCLFNSCSTRKTWKRVDEQHFSEQFGRLFWEQQLKKYNKDNVFYWWCVPALLDCAHDGTHCQCRSKRATLLFRMYLETSGHIMQKPKQLVNIVSYTASPGHAWPTRLMASETTKVTIQYRSFSGIWTKVLTVWRDGLRPDLHWEAPVDPTFLVLVIEPLSQIKVASRKSWSS